MARTELPNGVILPAEYSDDWYEDMTSNLTKLDDVIGSDSEKLNADGVYFLRMSSTALTDGGTGNFSDLNSSYKIKTGDLVLDSGRKLYQVVSVDSTNETFTVGNSLFKVTAESDLAPVAESGDYDDLTDLPTYGITRYCSSAITDNSSVAFSSISSTNKIKVGDFLLDTVGKLYQISSVDTANETVSVTTPLTQLAIDSSVVHNSGNEEVNGTKTFKNMIPIDGGYLGDESSVNARTNLCLRSNRDTVGKSGAYVVKYRPNKAQGSMGASDLVYISFDVLENEVRTSGIMSIQCRGWVDDVPKNVKIISGISDMSFGSADKPSKINDLNPGCLSLPDLNNGIDISGSITDLTGGTNNYTPLVDGYISLCAISTGSNGAFIKQGDFGSSGRDLTISGTRYVYVCLPVVKNIQADIVVVSGSLGYAKFYPCQGNV